MIKSMTGYGRSESIIDGKKYTVEIKSLNHRYLEVSVRMPSVLFPLEIEMKKKISGHFSRGKVEANVRIDHDGSSEGTGKYDLNYSAIMNYYELLVKLKNDLNFKDEITLGMMVGFKDIFAQIEPSIDTSNVWGRLEYVFDNAIIDLKTMRKREGEIIYRDLISRLESIRASLETISSRAPQVVLEYQRRITQRIKELIGNNAVDDYRLSQEIAILAEKSDITEEIIRLHSHLQQFSDILTSDIAAGRKTDFLLQEMIREVNTLGSKSSDLEISRCVVEIKSELGRMREQIQNIE